MLHLSSIETVFVLSVLAGAVQVLAPDHWLPASVLAWQRGWSIFRSMAFAFFAFVLHLSLGLLIYFVCNPFLNHLNSASLFVFALALILTSMGLRMFRFSRIREVLGAGPRSTWGFFAVFSLLGPAEAIIPILVRSGQIGIGYLTPTLAFGFGTVTVGLVCVVVGRLLWNKPLWLPRGIYWARKRIAVIPVAAGLVVGLTVILNVS
jgi:hypothetical protein